jgi:NAD(P)-dependent dehydrogenase (short-subunit alcohol dehydrogenase family)
MEQDQQVQPKVALVTGAARRLGRSIALALAQDGWDLVIHYRASAEAAQEVVDEIHRLGRRAIALAADLDADSEIEGLLPRCVEGLGEVRCVVNNASRFEYDSIAEFSASRLEAHMRSNLVAPVLLARGLFERRRALGSASGDAAVINLLDQKLFNPNPDFFSYTISKSALMAATTMLAQALAPHVRVVGVAPGITLPATGQSPDNFAAAHRATPLLHSSTPLDIARAVCYLASAAAVTGTTLLVDGGQHLVASERDVMFTAP